MQHMSVQAVGAYIQTLLSRQKLKTQEVTTTAGVSANYIWRLRAGKIENPGAQTLTALVRAVQGSMEDLANLLFDEQATVDDGDSAARAWLLRQSPEVQAEVARMQAEPTEIRQQAAYAYRRLADLIDAGHDVGDALRIVESELARGSEGAV